MNLMLNNKIQKIIQENKEKIKTYKKGSVIYFEGDICTNYDIIISGHLSIQNIDEEGNLNKICSFKSGDVLGEVLIFSDENIYPMNVVCLEDTEILHIKKEYLLKLCQINSEFLEILLIKISNKTLALKNKIKILTSKTLREKIINFLLKQEKLQKSKVIQLNSTKTELASYFGVQRTSLSRELQKMKQENIIDFDLKTITIINLD